MRQELLLVKVLRERVAALEDEICDTRAQYLDIAKRASEKAINLGALLRLALRCLDWSAEPRLRAMCEEELNKKVTKDAPPRL